MKDDSTPTENPNQFFQESKLSIDKNDNESKIINYIR